ncbi:clindamycin resistance transfer factor BtgB [Odoribacter laneus]|nr:clindamycin resistance transfer factor BtgB [Odoribacter laneus]GKI24732.1 clindamycin resistance transfer factor BtgB [Odoribacter laneus]
MERMEQGIYTEGFFNLTDDNVYKSQVIKDIDSNIGQLLKTDAKFYAIHASPSEKELRAMGATEQEQAKAMKRYIREVVIPEYAKNFNKGLSAEDIKFYGKIHFSRDRSDNELNMHCHLIVSRKDQSNKVKISPLTNHRNTKKGVITGGFDRTALFENVEKGFDKLFGYNRQLSETFEYCNTIKNGSIVDKLRMQERELNTPEQNFAGEKKKEKEDLQIGRYADKQADMIESKFANKQDSNSTDLGLSSVFGVLTPDKNNWEEEQVPVKKKKKKQRPRLS